MKKKILTGLAAAMVAAMMVGCGSGETAETTTAAAETTTAAAETAGETETETENELKERRIEMEKLNSRF